MRSGELPSLDSARRTCWQKMRRTSPASSEVAAQPPSIYIRQTNFSKETIIYNSRRTDVAPVSPSTAPVAGQNYTDVQKEGFNEFPDKVRTLTIQWLGNP